MSNKLIAFILSLAFTASSASVLPTASANADWAYENDNWYYYNENGEKFKDGWLYDTKTYKNWFHFDENGVMDTNKWIFDALSKYWYYVDEEGFKLKNTTKTFDNGLQYSFREDGSISRWYLDTKNGKVYYLDNDNNRFTFEPEFFSNLDINENTDEKVNTTLELGNIKQTKTVDGINYTLNIDLKKWDLYTSREQIWRISNLFWNCYPKMYKRFVSDVQSSDCEMTIAIEDEGYSPASCGGHRIHLNDMWLHDSPTDIDCITHELGHTLQNRYNSNDWDGWSGEFCGDSDYIENFADYCRYVYAYKDGCYNDDHWDPKKVKIKDGDTKCVNYNSIRFLLWLDYNYSDDKNDVMVKFSDVCRNSKIKQADWNNAWEEIFKDVPGLNGRSITDVWEQYLNDTGFSDADATVPYGRLGQKSQLLQNYNIREKLAK